ncbi:hypothetical protein D3C87_366100 [compost metagenome]
MNARTLLAACALWLPCAVAGQADDWQASLELRPAGDAAAPPPAVLVPKQSLVMKVTVWMPEQVNWNPRYPQWDMPGATILPLLMLTPTVQRDRGQSTQRGATQNYLLTPLAEGELRLSPEAIKVYPDAADSPVLQIMPVTLRVALPAGAGPLSGFLPASGLEAEQHFYLVSGDRPPQEVAREALSQLRLQTGQMLERRISIQALGLPASQIPAVQPRQDAAIQRESQAADLNDYGDFTGGKRTERWFYAPGDQETQSLGDVSIRWYDLGSREFRTANLEGGQIHAVVDKRAAGEIPLSWHERLRLLSARQWLTGLAGAVLLLAVAIVLCRGGGRLLWRTARKWRQRIATAERFLFLAAYSQIALWGTGSPRAWRACQRWMMRTGAAGMVDPAGVLREWGKAKYGPSRESGMPGRWRVQNEFVRLRAVFKKTATTGRRRHGLPNLSGLQGD